MLTTAVTVALSIFVVSVSVALDYLIGQDPDDYVQSIFLEQDEVIHEQLPEEPRDTRNGTQR